MRHEITDEAKAYWTQIPNIVCDMGLKPQTLALYVHMKRAAGASPNGKCYKSTRTLAKESGMGAGSVSRAKLELLRPFEQIGNRPLITIIERPNPKGGKPFQEVRITDIWNANMKYYASSNMEIQGEQVPESTKPSSKTAIRQVPDTHEASSTLEIKKNVTEEEQYVEEEIKNIGADALGQTEEDKLLDEFSSKLRDPRFDFERVA